jgi:hypothetical protein
MSDNSPIQINFKTKKDGMLINLRAQDGAELDLLLDQLTQRLAALVDLEKTVEGMAVVKDAFPKFSTNTRYHCGTTTNSSSTCSRSA